MSIENDIVETLTVICKEKGERGDFSRHQGQGWSKEWNCKQWKAV